MTRRMLLRAIKTIQDGGEAPGTSESYYNIRAIEEVLPAQQFGLDALAEKMYPVGV